MAFTNCSICNSKYVARFWFIKEQSSAFDHFPRFIKHCFGISKSKTVRFFTKFYQNILEAQLSFKFTKVNL